VDEEPTSDRYFRVDRLREVPGLIGL
jgi:hypothetical protein